MAFELDILRNITRGGASAATSAVGIASRLLEYSMRRNSAEQLSSVSPDTLTRRLQTFLETLDAFSWPDTDALWSRARLVVADPGLSQSVATDLRRDADAVHTYRFFSDSFDPNGAHGLAEGEHAMTLSYGGGSGKAPFTVGAGDITWSDVLDKFTDAVNALDLPVQAELVRQTVPEQKVAGLMKTGTVVALTVDAAYEGDLDIDLRESLPRELGFEAPITSSVGKPAVAEYSVRPYQRAIPSTYYSQVVDPNAPATLAQGEHFFSWSTGAESGTVSVSVEAGDTWSEVLHNTANALNSAQDDFQAFVAAADRYEYLDLPDGTSRRIGTTGEQLALTDVQPKLGEAITFGFGAASDAVTAFFDPTSGLPPETQGTSYIATATANGWTEGNIYSLSTGSTTWVETVPQDGDVRYVAGLLGNYRYDGGSWSSAQNFVTATGLDRTAWPGQDGAITVNGETMSSASNTYALDDGHLLLSVQEPVGDVLPLKVVEALEQVEESMRGVVESYNGLTRFLEADASMWRGGFRSQWGGPVAQRRAQLEWMGVRELHDTSLLWVDADRFFAALEQDADRAKRILLGADEPDGAMAGLIPQWKAMVSEALAAGSQSFLDISSQNPKFPWRTSAMEDEADAVILNRKE